MPSILGLLRRSWARARASQRPVEYARSIGVSIGEDCRIFSDAYTCFGSEPYLITVGRHVTLTRGVQFITHDGGVWVLRDKYPQLDVLGRIRIGDNVFVGTSAILLPGIQVGSNSIIGAGSVVARDVPEGTVVAGNPARPIRSLAEYERNSLENGLHVRDAASESKRSMFIAHLDRKDG